MVKDLLRPLKALAGKRRELSLIDMGKHDPDYDEAMSRVVELRDRYEGMELRPEDRETINSILDGLDDVEEAQAKKLLKLFMQHIDRTVLDSFSHANIGPKATKAGRLLLEVERELEQAVPNLTMKYEEGVTPDDFALLAVDTALHSAKPSFANHKMFRGELGENYVIASCYNGLLLGGGSYTLCRLILGNIAKRAKDIKDFKENQLPYVMDIMARYMDARIKFEVEESGFFENNFLAKEGFIHKDRFTAMYGMVGMAECVNILFEKEGRSGRYGLDQEATGLGVEFLTFSTATLPSAATSTR